MVSVVSIEWNVEEFRRLISDQPRLVDPDSVIERAVRVLNIEVSSPSSAKDNLQTSQPTDFAMSEGPPSPSQTAVDVSKNENESAPFAKTETIEPSPRRHHPDSAPHAAVNVLNLTISDAAQAPGHRALSEEGSLSKIGPNAVGVERDREANILLAAVDPEAIETADEIQPEVSHPVDARLVELQSIQKAIFVPDNYTAKVDRYRAIDLCWKLRDIAANRLKLSPIREDDLLILIDLELVELRDGVPQLTSTGVKVIS